MRQLIAPRHKKAAGYAKTANRGANTPSICSVGNPCDFKFDTLVRIISGQETDSIYLYSRFHKININYSIICIVVNLVTVQWRK